VHKTTRLTILCAVILLSSAVLRAGQTSPEDSEAIAHARQLFQLMRDDKVEDVAKEFDAKMSAAMTAAQLRSVMDQIRQQAGGFQSYIEERVQRPQQGYTAVMFGCQFEKNGVNAMFVFDADKKLAGLQFRPRP